MDTRLSALRALVTVDLKLFFRDKRSVILNLVTPLAIAGLFGMVFGGGSSAPAGRLAIAVVDQDGSGISRAVTAGLTAEKTLEVSTFDEPAARELVRKGKIRAAVVLPAGFGEAAGRAFLRSAERPRVPVLYDPSQAATLAMVQGMLTQQVFTAVTADLFGGDGGADLIDDSLARLDAHGADPATTEDLRELLTRPRSLNQRNRAQAGSAAAPRGGLAMPFEVGASRSLRAGHPTTPMRTPLRAWACSSS